MAAAAQGPPRFGIIGGSGVQLEGQDPWVVETPFGPCLLSFIGDDESIIFANRHLCTSVDPATKKADYAPPHLVNYHALIWALVIESRCTAGIIALGSCGTLHPETVPVGSILMSDDYYMVRPEPMTFFGRANLGRTSVPEDGGVGRIHYSPCNPLDTKWVSFRQEVQRILQPVLEGVKDQVRLAKGQTPEIWPCAYALPAVGSTPSAAESLVYVNSIGPRFETRAEIRAYQAVGHVVGMTCAREWALCEEICAPYCLLCFCDNACNGLSTHPGGALEEYLEHKQKVSTATEAVIKRLVAELPKSAPASS